ncbi:hypothetical protein ACTFIR_011757 [Dictyostelium discoideum]
MHKEYYMFCKSYGTRIELIKDPSINILYNIKTHVRIVLIKEGISKIEAISYFYKHLIDSFAMGVYFATNCSVIDPSMFTYENKSILCDLIYSRILPDLKLTRMKLKDGRVILIYISFIPIEKKRWVYIGSY